MRDFDPTDRSLSRRKSLSQEVRKRIGSVFSLPARLGGLGIQNPVDTSDSEYFFSKLMTENLSAAVLKQEDTLIVDDVKNSENKLIVRRVKNDQHQRKIDEIKLKSTPEEIRTLDLIAEKGASS